MKFFNQLVLVSSFLSIFWQQQASASSLEEKIAIAVAVRENAKAAPITLGCLMQNADEMYQELTLEQRAEITRYNLELASIQKKFTPNDLQKELFNRLAKAVEAGQVDHVLSSLAAGAKDGPFLENESTLVYWLANPSLSGSFLNASQRHQLLTILLTIGKADANSSCLTKEAPLYAAILANDIDAVVTLVVNGANPYQLTPNSWSYLQVAAQDDARLEIAEFLLKWTIIPNDAKGELRNSDFSFEGAGTALWIAEKRDQKKMVKLLLYLGLDPQYIPGSNQDTQQLLTPGAQSLGFGTPRSPEYLDGFIGF